MITRGTFSVLQIWRWSEYQFIGFHEKEAIKALSVTEVRQTELHNALKVFINIQKWAGAPTSNLRSKQAMGNPNKQINKW